MANTVNCIHNAYKLILSCTFLCGCVSDMQTITDSESYKQYCKQLQLLGIHVHDEESHIKLPVDDHKQHSTKPVFLAFHYIA